MIETEFEDLVIGEVYADSDTITASTTILRYLGKDAEGFYAFEYVSGHPSYRWNPVTFSASAGLFWKVEEKL